jgi:hypothetical protein
MGLLEDFKLNKINIVFIIVVLILIFNLYWKKDNIETMANLDSEQRDQVKQLIYDTYRIDVNAIKNLSEIATRLQAGGITIPGNATISNTLTAKGPILLDHNVDHPTSGDGALYRAEGQVYMASDDLIRFKQQIANTPHKIQFDVRSGTANFDGELHVGGKIFSKQDLSIYNQNKLAKDNNSYEWKFVNYPGEGTGRGNLTLGEVNKNNEWRNRIRFNDNGGETNLWSDLNISGNLRIENNGKLIMDNNTEIDKDRLFDFFNTQAGHITTRGNKGQGLTTIRVNFDTPFRRTPFIHLSFVAQDLSGTLRVRYWASEESPTGFNFNMFNWGGNTFWWPRFSWLAIAVKSAKLVNENNNEFLSNWIHT